MEEKEEQFTWLGTVSAPAEYPVYPYSGAIIAKDFSYSFDHIWGVCGSGWGNDSGTMSVSTERMSVPDSLEFTWYSVKENKFYTGKWKLPHERIYNLFKDGFIDGFSGKHETYNNIIIGLAPKGRVTVWLGGGQQVEVTSLQAHDTLLTRELVYEDFKYVFDEDFSERNMGYMLPEVKEKIKKYGYPSPDIYETYKKKYLWRPILNIPELDKLRFFGISYYNGEMEDILNDIYFKREYKIRAIPKNFGFFWFDKKGEEFYVKIKEFEEKEIFQAFAKLGNSTPIDFVVEIKDKNSVPRLYFTNKRDTVEIKSSKPIFIPASK
ncbi:DUF2931 family protein [Apibacter raozihei]|uniref:DUF2931 family protein n=1 Tax=Apibacter raozihei TaxID=2500547 RepID=UPI001E5CB8C2|nr:DUF2931 family protein [Apibacter raozihei]